jgi:tellurite resistance protein TerC
VELGFLFADALGKPVWIWLAFLATMGALLAFDLGVLHKDSREIGGRASLVMSGVYVGVGLAFGAWVG